jgi:hypothetical protein
VQSNREVSFTLRCPDAVNPCSGTVRLVAGGSPQAGPDAIALGPQGQATYTIALDDVAWNKLITKANQQISGSLKLKATGSSGTSLSGTIDVQLKLV